MAAAKKTEKKKSSGGPKFNKSSKKPFKTKKDSDSAMKPEAISLQLEDDVPDFPRGGGSSLSRREREEIYAEVDEEFQSEGAKFIKKKGKKVKKKRPETEDDLGSLFSDGITGKLPRYANKITSKNIFPGMKLLGVIAEVNEKDLVISLPGGLRGLVRAVDAFDPVMNNEVEDMEDPLLPTLFHTGQLVSSVVLQLDDDKKEKEKEKGKRKIWLSLRLSVLHKAYTLDALQEGMILTSYVKSIEDHGYILHFGVPSFSGFLPKNSQPERRDNDVSIGQLVQGVVRSIDKTRKVVYLVSDPETVSKNVTKDLKGISIDLLVPGMMVIGRVQSTLENGVMLSFLTYFTGTVDMYHLQNNYPSKDWKDDYNQNKKVNARILFIDPSTRAIGLTLNPHLVHNKAPPSHVKIGDIYEDSKVVRVDRGLGLLLEIQSSPVSTPAYVSISDAAEEEVQKLEKKFREGSRVRVRVLGFRHLEGLATGMLKASAFEGSVFTHSDVKPGMVVRAKIIAVDSFGAIVQFPGGIKALCPLRHMSEFEIAKPGKKFKVGADLSFRVLGCKSKRITVTHKKTLVKSKHEILSSYANASEGLITHGWITKIEKHGCFVRFYNGVQGFAPRSELGLEAGADASSVYHVGQVVKCRITSTVPSSRRINLSFVIKPKRVPEDEIVKIGSLISGVVDDITPDSIVVYINGKSHSKGTIHIEHLADHHVHAALMKSVLKPGVELNELLVLDIEGSNLILSAKHSLICSATQLPSDLSQITPNVVLHGYVCNLIETGCFVRFLGRLTGFSPKRMATDDRKIQLSEAYHVGQSVRSNILDVSSETGRMTLSLKLSNCSSIDASFIQEYFITEEKIARLQSLDSTGPELKWVEGFDIGSVVEGKVQEVKDIGVVISFEKYTDVFGFITLHELGGSTVESGSAVQAAVLDVAKAERVVDLSLKPEFVNKAKETSKKKTHKKKRKREGIEDLEVNQVVKAIVEIVKENYLILSLPEYDFAIGYASVADYNNQRLPHKLLMSGQSVSASVMALPSSSTVGRLLLLLNSTSEITETSSSKREKKKSSYKVGSLVQAEITEIRPLEMRLKFGIGFQGRLHITELYDDYDNVVEAPFSNFRVGQIVTARIVAKANQSHNHKKSSVLELSIKPKALANFSETVGDLMDEDLEFSIGQHVTGYISNVNNDWAWLTVTRHVSARLFILDSSCEPSELLEFSKRLHAGKPISGHVLSIDKEKKMLRLIARPLSASSPGNLNGEVLKMGHDPHNILDEKDGSYIHKGDIVGGKISKILPGVGGMLVQISPNIYGKIHFTELTDSWEPNPLSGYQEGNFVKCKVLEITHPSKCTIHVDLSLCSSLMTENNNLKFSGKQVKTFEDLSPNMEIQGYVKSVTPKGCFILLSRNLDAKILLSNLSDGYVDDLLKEFPVGKLVKGRVASLEPLSRRVEVTLKTPNASGASKSKMSDLSSLHVGEIINGRIKRVESYGLFITIEHTNMVGLCHVSELSDDPIDKLESKYKAWERVTAKILKVDEERQRISLGMKSSHVLDKSNSNDMPSKQEPEQPSGDHDSADESELDISLDNDSFQEQNADVEFPALVQAESRASVPPLEVSLDDLDQEDMNIVVPQSEEHLDVSDAANGKNKRREKKKAKEEKEREIRAAEERLLEKDIPRTSDEFEKLIRNSPSSSYLWIKYMAFMVSMADVEKARYIAERALKTINIREEKEKLNVWVAYFNLENKYGNPPEEAVKKVFQRALQVNDPKKVNLSLLGVYERTEQHKFADELLDKMVKKFKHSCKVWLKRVQSLLNRQQDGVQSVVNRALLCLPRHKHIKFISQTAILEFKSGVPERGRSMFEGILREYPKRTDLWSIYLDQEIRLGDVDLIRALFERAISLSLPPKKMKFLFKKYLEYEKTLGDEERIESVKQKALDYVESTLA